MRCQFCGWDNPEGSATCEKCNKPLGGTGAQSTPQDRPTDRQAGAPFNPKATVRESGGTAPQSGNGGEVCPQCGYPLENGVCASCGYTSQTSQGGTSQGNPHASSADAFGRKTMRPQRKGEKEGAFLLTPISEETGTPEGEDLAFEGNEVLLNRENTDSKNMTITSQKQAVIRREGGVWTIEDLSEYQTTFVQAARHIELQDGDLILLGNQLYRFKL